MHKRKKHGINKILKFKENIKKRDKRKKRCGKIQNFLEQKRGPSIYVQYLLKPVLTQCQII